MKPKQLTMQAFGPYSEPTTIDFDALTQDSSLYLITGDTGAGKTMIFDAISYALFGSDSGHIRDGNELRSSFVEDKVSTEVTLLFEHAGKEYKITRRIRLWAEKGDVALTNGPKTEVELTFGSQTLTKTNEVKDKISEILGMDQDQFEQISMIAQGQFRKLLSAKSEERKALFRQLFRTENYTRLLSRISSEKSRVESEFADIKSKISAAQETIELDPEMIPEFYADLYENSDVQSLKTAVDGLSDLVSRQRKDQKDISSKVKALDTELSKLQEESGKLNAFAKIQENLDKKSRELPALEETKTQAEQTWETTRKNKTEIEALTEQISIKTNRLGDYDVLDERNAELTKNQNRQKTLTQDIATLEKTLKETEESLNTLNQERTQIKNAPSEKAGLERKLADKRAEYKEYDNLLQKIETAQAQQATLKAAQEAFKQAEEESRAYGKGYSELRAKYYRNQAGLLAENLEDGEPCPVCGSVHHPGLAVREDQAPTKDELDAAEAENERLVKAMSEASGTAKTAADTFEAMVADFKKAGRVLLPGIPIKTWVPELKSRKKAIKQEGTGLRTRYDALDKDIKRLSELETLIPDTQKTLEESRTQKSGKESELSGLTASAGRLSQELATLKANLEKASRKEAQEEITQLEKTRTTLQTALETAEKNKADADQAYATALQEINTYKGQLKGYDPERKEQLDKELLDKQEQKETLSTALSELQMRVRTNETAFKKLQTLQEKYIAAEQERTELRELNEAANAISADGTGETGKVDFEAYVQQAYFDRVLNRANSRLYRMSGKRYRLHRRTVAKDRKSQTGLDIDVSDQHTGSSRHAETLSGGESFLASMALALGFSDIVQETAGGVHIESLFIDEGFGTLDEDSLNAAIMALQDLASGDRTVAVISHVTELQEKIENELVVEKSANGPSTVRMVTPRTGN